MTFLENNLFLIMIFMDGLSNESSPPKTNSWNGNQTGLEDALPTANMAMLPFIAYKLGGSDPSLVRIDSQMPQKFDDIQANCQTNQVIGPFFSTKQNR
jgi:hypothetical protein